MQAIFNAFHSQLTWNTVLMGVECTMTSWSDVQFGCSVTFFPFQIFNTLLCVRVFWIVCLLKLFQDGLKCEQKIKKNHTEINDLKFGLCALLFCTIAFVL